MVKEFSQFSRKKGFGERENRRARVRKFLTHGSARLAKQNFSGGKRRAECRWGLKLLSGLYPLGKKKPDGGGSTSSFLRKKGKKEGGGSESREKKFVFAISCHVGKKIGEEKKTRYYH